MRNIFSETLYKVATENPKTYIVVADISPAGSMSKFREQYPERFINVGVAEQSMIGLCAGLALRGNRPYAYTIATFTLYRPFEMIRDDVCYQNLPVTLVGIGGGVTYSTLGSTHHAQEDIALMSAIPNMSILAPCDPLETEAATWASNKVDGPLYLRIGQTGAPTLTQKAVDPFVFGEIRYIERGTDVCFLSYGSIMKMASDVADEFKRSRKSVSLISVHTLKPLDVEGIAKALAYHKQVIVIEEHSERGGLAARVKEIAWESQARCKLNTFSLKDEFIHFYGPHPELLKAHGISPDIILKATHGVR
jgi:transketolase